MNEKQQNLCNDHGYDFLGLKALFLNCNLKPSGQLSLTGALINVSKTIKEANDITAEILRPIDYTIPPGIYPDMTKHVFEQDD